LIRAPAKSIRHTIPEPDFSWISVCFVCLHSGFRVQPSGRGRQEWPQDGWPFKSDAFPSKMDGQPPKKHAQPFKSDAFPSKMDGQPPKSMPSHSNRMLFHPKSMLEYRVSVFHGQNPGSTGRAG
jgi:hypothetical protein